ncbi:TIGR03885 family FMN-dependent LLM class oxidoreductase [Paraflavitalea pollutisoli]|uniref:TIGR03885 family FMN-dependent LLM class oxidoreductase n=1 Tax=Paraflavitalea pollutisoli TaxID=3034143 RepID=UPI0023EBED03|nr:TIGR03885 family FMN-dependent LLM class oxidoreductase [Paraflavitalea sp. H1-2-19X]
MCTIAYHASHEQFSPAHLLQLVIQAQAAGFGAIHSSDHFYPWSERQGHSGFSLSWLGAAMQATTLPFSVICAPGPRYHPAVLAQAAATLAELFPRRFSLELGSGEALNENITGAPWPPKQQRNERLRQAAQMMQRLLAGEEITEQGHFNAVQARLYSLPAEPPALFGAAITAATAAWCGQWAAGLLTTAGDPAEVQEKVDAFRQGGGEGKPVYLQFAFSFHPDHAVALHSAHDQWRSNLVSTGDLADFSHPRQFDEASANISPAQVAEKLPIICTTQDLFRQVDALAATGANRVILHNVNRHQELFIQQVQGHLHRTRLKVGLESF